MQEHESSDSKRKGPLFFTAMVLATLSAGAAQAQNTQAKFVPFQDFLQGVKGADTSEFLARPDVKVKEPANFEQMRGHILNMYQGVSVTNSYVLDKQTYDCVPVDQQPSLRILGLNKIAAPPPASAATGQSLKLGDSSNAKTVSQLPQGVTADAFGNHLGCEAHTIPLRRLTLDELGRFHNLKEFFEKGPDGAGQPPKVNKEPAPSIYSHKYAYTYEYANNLGGNSNINLWRPYVNTSESEIFSLAQLWTVGLSSGPVQTAEAGWQNFPAKYGSENSALFIYWTADGYNNTGCYNQDCGGFVQVSNNMHLGAGFTNYSWYGSSQYEVELQYYLWEGNWWLRFNGEWAGYYPASIYRGGQLSAYSNLLEFGSESVGTWIWPPEGSGLWAADGWTWAGYQRILYNVNLSGTSVWDSLTAAQPSPACYSISGPYWGGSAWGIYFFFGGPGGTGC